VQNNRKAVEYDYSIGLTLLYVRVLYRSGRDGVISGAVHCVEHGLDRRVRRCQ